MKKAPVGSKTGKTTAIGAMSRRPKRRPKRGLKAGKATAHHAAHPGRAKMGLTAIGGMSLSPKAAQKPKKPKAPVKRKWSPGSEVACCAAEALGTLLGWGPDEVLDLYWRTADDPDAGATIPATLEAAALAKLGHITPPGCVYRLPLLGAVGLTEHPVTELAGVLVEANEIAWSSSDQPAARPCPAADLACAVLAESHGLILGVWLPEPHAVAVTPDGRWWSWGEPFDPDDWPELVIEEAWAVLL